MALLLQCWTANWEGWMSLTAFLSCPHMSPEFLPTTRAAKRDFFASPAAPPPASSPASLSSPPTTGDCPVSLCSVHSDLIAHLCVCPASCLLYSILFLFLHGMHLALHLFCAYCAVFGVSFVSLLRHFCAFWHFGILHLTCFCALPCVAALWRRWFCYVRTDCLPDASVATSALWFGGELLPIFRATLRSDRQHTCQF